MIAFRVLQRQINHPSLFARSPRSVPSVQGGEVDGAVHHLAAIGEIVFVLVHCSPRILLLPTTARDGAAALARHKRRFLNARRDAFFSAGLIVVAVSEI